MKSKNVYLDYEQIHKAVESSRAYWDGWKAVFITYGDGFSETTGKFINGKWVNTLTIEPNSRGLWRTPARLVRHIT